MSYNGSDTHKENLAKARSLAYSIKKPCPHCDKSFASAGYAKHEKCCHLNPVNIRHCEVCSKPIKNFRTSKTCSYSCANKHFRTGENHGNWKPEAYRTTCFAHHKKECVVCGESNIVEVHHLDEDHTNNDPRNLIPLCPTHHQYWHSKHKHLIEQVVHEYIAKWSEW